MPLRILSTINHRDYQLIYKGSFSMKTLKTLMIPSSLLALSLFLTGCGDQSDEQADAPMTQSQTATDGDHGHPHDEDGGHGHSHGEGGHSHGAGPHDGTLADWGGGAYHVEFTVDHDKQEATVYILGSDEKTPEPIAAETLLLTIKEPSLQADLKPVPMDGESGGKSSRFVGTHEGLGTVREYEGTISAEVDGTPYAGNFKEEAHGHEHGHSHGEEDALVWEGEPKQAAGYEIKLGHHGKHLHAGEEVEPAVAITKDGEDVSDAKVFNALVNTEGEVVAEEVATVFEPKTEEEPAHYAQGGLAIPKDVSKVVIRFRIELPGEESATFDVPVEVE